VIVFEGPRTGSARLDQIQILQQIVN